MTIYNRGKRVEPLTPPDLPELAPGECSRCLNGEHGLILDNGRCLCCSIQVRDAK